MDATAAAQPVADGRRFTPATWRSATPAGNGRTAPSCRNGRTSNLEIDDRRLTVTPQIYSTEGFRPIAYVALDDLAIRSRVVAILEEAGWTAIVEPTGFHLLRSIADVIDGSRTWLRPGLIVMDAFARGCTGTTIALGLRDLGITIPIVLALAPGQSCPVRSGDHMLHVVEPHSVERIVRELARSTRTPPHDLSCDPTRSSPRAA
jgi:hypothetical protein